MMHRPASGFEAELRASPFWVAVVMFGFGIFLAVAGGLHPELPAWWLVLVVALLAVPAVAWWQYHRHDQFVRWLVVLSPALMIGLAAWWSGLAALLALLAVPVLLAATLIGMPMAMLLGLGETAAVALWALLVPRLASLPAALIAIMAIWMSLAAVYTAYRPIWQLAAWAWGYYQNAQQQLAEAQNDRALLEQTLAELLHANRQVSLANDRMAALRQAAEDARKSKEAFAARVSHEFRAPLNVIIGLVGLMVENPDLYESPFPPAAVEHLQTVQRNCKHLAGMIDDVLDLSQVDAGQMVLRREPVDFSEVIEWATAMVRPMLEHKGLTLNVEVPPDLPLVYCDRIRIRQVILNLVSNAARFTDTGSITVRASHSASGSATTGRVTVSVTDTGPGISPEDAQRIFEPFVQGQNDPRRIRGGTGLGLSISKQFVTLHGGRIWAESQPGAGATFHIELPVDAQAPVAAASAGWIKEEWEWYEGQTGPNLPASQYRPRYVVCDADGELCRTFARERESAEFVAVRSLDAALNDLAQCPAQALIVNAAAGEDPRALIERARDQVRDTPIIGCAYPSRAAQARAAGALDYLVKPLNVAALAVALQPLGPLGRVLIVDDDPDARELISLALRSLHADVAVQTAADGAEALAQLRAWPADLVLLDVVMAGMGGWETLAAMQVAPALRSIPVIIVSAQELAPHEAGEGPASSPMLLATIDRGFTPSRLLACSTALAEAMLA
jgi:signal transduction histidine kinase/CheY-like chemotaxis protein